MRREKPLKHSKLRKKKRKRKRLNQVRYKKSLVKTLQEWPHHYLETNSE